MKRTCLCAILLLGSAAAWCQPAPIDPSRNAVDPCRAEVSRFEQVIGFVRQNQGERAARELKEKLLPAQVEQKILFTEGYCGLAKYLRDKKLTR